MDERLVQTAIEALGHAHAPYSRFAVGAALRTDTGAVFSGCNVENASYGMTVCAERNAIAAMVAAGGRRIHELVVVTDTPEPVTPCGACRQVIAEFANPDTRIVCTTTGGEQRSFMLGELLPHRFDGNLITPSNRHPYPSTPSKSQ